MNDGMGRARKEGGKVIDRRKEREGEEDTEVRYIEKLHKKKENKRNRQGCEKESLKPNKNEKKFK